ncbi:MAG: class I SAM-dependent methyltransferase [Defluviitaleaceae bacterium]|nr:class I SAM-dependent methyltransferase [Defluviitaleaceae bacterium]MCL2238876.1 class I SAM-dependent methyltransferase [Defluviitaleaceae bacterium]
MKTPFRLTETTPNANLSPRLAVALSMVGGDCATLADIGTDHAQLPVAAVKLNMVVRAIACDIAPGPLSHAVTTIYAAKMGDRITTRLGDGFDPLQENEFDVAVIAGIGGMNIVGILERGSAKAKTAKRLILQPQHDTMKLRRNLHRLGYYIADEKLAREGDRFYVLIMVTPSVNPSLWKEKEYSLGKHLDVCPEWKEYLTVERDRLESYIASGATGEKRDEYAQRLIWLKEEIGG